MMFDTNISCKSEFFAIKKNLVLLFSSTNNTKFFFTETLIIDLLDRFCSLNNDDLNEGVLNNQVLVIRFEVVFPFLNLLSKFRNKVLMLLNVLVFEILTGRRPLIVPVYNKTIQTSLKKRNKKIIGSRVVVKRFLFSARLSHYDIFNFLFLLRLYISKNTYPKLVVPSKYVQVGLRAVREKSVAYFSFKSSFSNFDFFNTVDEVLGSKTKLFIMFWNKKFKSNFFLAYILQSLNFNITDFFLGSKNNNNGNNDCVIARVPNSF